MANRRPSTTCAGRVLQSSNIEVKTRRAGGLTTPEEAITPRKFASLRRAAEAYMTQHRVRLEPQFDLAAVDLFPDGSMNVRFTERAMECNW